MKPSAVDGLHLVSKRESGGFGRLDKILDGELFRVLKAFDDAIWSAA